jgi:hypothetical protein
LFDLSSLHALAIETFLFPDILDQKYNLQEKERNPPDVVKTSFLLSVSRTLLIVKARALTSLENASNQMSRSSTPRHRLTHHYILGWIHCSPEMSSPAPVAIESTIRDIISELYRTNKLEELTVKRVRIAAEQELSLDPGWFKTHEVWKDRSKKFIEEEAVCEDMPML